MHKNLAEKARNFFVRMLLKIPFFKHFTWINFYQLTLLN